MDGADSSATVRALSRAVATFLVAGVGIGLAGVVFLDRMGPEGLVGDLLSSGYYLFVVAVAFLVGPVVALVVGLESDGQSPLGDGFGSAIGYLGMIGVVIVLLSFVAEGTGSDAGETLSEWFVTILLASVPTGLVAVGVAWLGDRFR